MGCFSWLYCNSKKPLNEGMQAYVYCPDGSVIEEKGYEDYGEFGGKDIYDLVADWNREYLSQHPDFLVPQHHGGFEKAKRVDQFFWYKHYADLSLSREEVVKNVKGDPEYTGTFFEYRSIGIDIACYDDQNAWLPYPIKIATRPDILCGYEGLPASEGDPNQGWGKSRNAKKDEDDYTPNMLPWRGTHCCPVCGSRQFNVTAHVAQDWLVDGDGEYLQTLTECSEIDHTPDDEDIWECACCGLSETGEFFTKKHDHHPRFAMKIYDRNLPYVEGLVGEECNDEKVIRIMYGEDIGDIVTTLWPKTTRAIYQNLPYAIIDTQTGNILTRGTLPVSDGDDAKLLKLCKIPLDMLNKKERVYFATVNGSRNRGPYGLKSEAALACEELRREWEHEMSTDDKSSMPVFSVEEDDMLLAHIILQRG